MALRLRIVPLATALLVHALVIAAMLSTLQVGAFGESRWREAELERTSPGATEALIFTCSNCDSAERGDKSLPLRSSFRPDLKLLRVSMPQAEVRRDAPSPLGPSPRAASHSGVLDTRCEVHIHQDLEGHVQAIDFGPCTENTAWQHTLLRRIIEAAALASPSLTSRPPELTLTLNTNRISAPLLARVLSQSSTTSGKGLSEKIITWRSQ